MMKVLPRRSIFVSVVRKCSDNFDFVFISSLTQIIKALAIISTFYIDASCILYITCFKIKINERERPIV